MDDAELQRLHDEFSAHHGEVAEISSDTVVSLVAEVRRLRRALGLEEGAFTAEVRCEHPQWQGRITLADDEKP